MTEDVDSYSQAEIVRLLKRLDTSVGGLRNEVHALGTTFVTRAELDAWRTSYDRELKQVKVDISGIETAAAPVKVSGWTIAAFALSAIVGLGSLLGLAITLITLLK